MVERDHAQQTQQLYKKNKLLRDSQHRFVKGHSCATNLILFMDKLTKIVDDNKMADVIYLDFSKAFDNVPRQRLLLKLKRKGIGGLVLTWIEAWLTGRTQAVRVGEEDSAKREVGSGVPQGSVLGPLLFDIFIDDIDECAEELELLLKFADDTKGLKEVAGEADRVKLQSTLDKLSQWATTWSMEFNVDKCKVMHVGRQNREYKYYMGGVELHAVEEHGRHGPQEPQTRA